MTFADRIRQARNDRHYSQEALAIAAGVSRRTIQNVEAGRPVSAETARSIMAVLDIDGAGAFASIIPTPKWFSWAVLCLAVVSLTKGVTAPVEMAWQWVSKPDEELLSDFALSQGVASLTVAQRAICAMVSLPVTAFLSAMLVLMGMFAMSLHGDAKRGSPEIRDPRGMTRTTVAIGYCLGMGILCISPMGATLDVVMVPSADWVDRLRNVEINTSIAFLTLFGSGVLWWSNGRIVDDMEREGIV